MGPTYDNPDPPTNGIRFYWQLSLKEKYVCLVKKFIFLFCTMRPTYDQPKAFNAWLIPWGLISPLLIARLEQD